MTCCSLIDLYTLTWKIWALLVRFFGKMNDFINFEAVQDGIDDAIMKVELPETVSDNGFIDDETQIDENLEDYYAFINVNRSVEDALHNPFLESESIESPDEVNNYCNDNYDWDSEQIDKFRDSAKGIREFRHTL